MIKYLLLILLITSPLLAQEVEISQQSNSMGSYYSEVSYKGSFDSLSITAVDRSHNLGYSHYINVNNDFYSDDTSFFCFATYQFSSTSYEYFDFGIGGYFINKEYYKLSVAGLIRDQKYLTSIRNKIVLNTDDYTLRDVWFYYPELNDSTNELDLSWKLKSENVSVGYRINFDFGNVSEKMYVKYDF